jgi:hypothetical protein
MNETRERLKLPATGLIVVGVVNITIGVLGVLQMLLRLTRGEPSSSTISDPDQRLGYMVGFFVWPILMSLGALVAPLVIYGGVQMYAAKRYSAARLAALLAMIPVTSCCFVAGIPIGLWAFFVLRLPEVRAAFHHSKGAPDYGDAEPRR